MTDLKHSDVTAMLVDRHNVLDALHTQQAIDETFITGSAVLGNADLMQYLRGFPDGFIARIPSISADAVQRLRNQIMVGETPDPKVLMSGSHRGEKKKRKDREDQLELQRYLKAELEHLDAQSGMFIEAADHILGLGMAVIAYPFLKSRVPANPFYSKRSGLTRRPRNASEETKLLAYQRSRRGALPFAPKVVHPVCAFFDVYNTPIEDMITEEKVRLGELAPKYPHLAIPTASYGAEGTLVSYCSAKWHGQWLNDKAVLTGKGVNEDGIAPNITGIMWYGMAKSGYGFPSAKGFEHSIQGVIRGVRSAILSLITDYNVQEIMKLLYVWPEKDFTVTDGKGELEMDAYETGPNAIFVHGSSVRRNAVPAAQVPAWVFEVQNLNSSMMESHVGSRVLSGEDEDDTASGLRTRLGLARAPTRITKRSLERMFAQMTMDMVWIQKHEVGAPLCIPTAGGYEDFDASKIPDEARIDIDLTPATQEDISFQLDDLLKRKQAGAASTKRILETDPSVDDVEDELINIDADAIMAMGETLQTASAEANRRFQEKIAALNPVEAATPGALPGDPAQVATLGSPQDLAMQAQMSRNGATVAPPPLR